MPFYSYKNQDFLMSKTAFSSRYSFPVAAVLRVLTHFTNGLLATKYFLFSIRFLLTIIICRLEKSIKKEGISTPLHLPCNQERCPSFGRSSLCLYCAALFINGRSRVKTSCLRQPLTRPVLSVLVELVSVAMFLPIQGFLYTL